MRAPEKTNILQNKFETHAFSAAETGCKADENEIENVKLLLIELAGLYGSTIIPPNSNGAEMNLSPVAVSFYRRPNRTARERRASQ